MNFISNVAIMVVPRWVRTTVLLVPGTLASIYLATAMIGILDNNRPGWIEAGTYILGILLPFLLGGLLLSYSHSGVDALVARTASFLTETIPMLTVLFEEPGPEFRDVPSRLAAQPRKHPPIRIQAAANLSIANYIVKARPQGHGGSDNETPVREVVFRVELNATKANVNILIPCSLLKAASTEADPVALFPHSIAGARHEGYWIAETVIERVIEGKDYCGIVAVKRLDPEFLTNPVLRLDFGQDLILMLRAMLNERPDLFAAANQAPA